MLYFNKEARYKKDFGQIRNLDFGLTLILSKIFVFVIIIHNKEPRIGLLRPWFLIKEYRLLYQILILIVSFVKAASHNRFVVYVMTRIVIGGRH